MDTVIFLPFTIYKPAETDRVAVVTSIGIDKNGEDIELSLNVITPSSQGATSGGSVGSVKTFAAIGKNLSTAISKISLSVGKSVGLAHCDAVVVSKDIVLGEGNIILENTIIQPFVEIGAGNLFWHNVKIAHDDKIGSFNTFAQNTSVAGVVNIGNNCFFGNSSIILNRKNIADYTLVGAGAICKADTNPYDVIVPAKGVVLENRKSIDYI